MGKMVGLSRAIKPEWLDKAAKFAVQGEDEAVIKEKLTDYLAFEITSPTNLRKTREILLNIWVRSGIAAPEIHGRALAAFEGEQHNKLALHWAMLLLAYPVFADVCCRIGKIGMVQDTFTTSWLREKLTETWGDRTTLFHSCDKILQTLKSLGAIKNKKVGTYEIVRQDLSDENTVSVLLLSLLALERQAYYDVAELSKNPLFFPFEFSVSLDWLHRSELFNLSSFGGGTVLSGVDS
jgi:hypothetical protein